MSVNAKIKCLLQCVLCMLWLYWCIYNTNRDSSLLLISWILFILNIITFIQMTIFFRSIKFENLVIFSGIIITSIIAAAILTKYEFILEINFGLHIVVLSYIIRRFLHLSTSRMKRTLFPTLGRKMYTLNLWFTIS